MIPRQLALSTVSALLLAACADPAREPAEAALVAADTAVFVLAPDAERLAPDEVRAARALREAALAAAARNDWKGARLAAAAVPEKVRLAMEVAAARREELGRRWAQAKLDVSNLLYALEDRLDELGESGRLPRGLERGTVEAAQAELAATRAEWERVQPLAERGDAVTGVARAEGLKARVGVALAQVGLR